MIKALFGALGQVGIDLGLRGDPCARSRGREVAVGIAENFGDASIQVWSLDQDQPGSPFLHRAVASQTTALRRVNASCAFLVARGAISRARSPADRRVAAPASDQPGPTRQALMRPMSADQLPHLVWPPG